MAIETNSNYKAIVIGCSAGGFSACFKLLSLLTEEFPLPIIIVQHLSKDNNMVEVLSRRLNRNIFEVLDKEMINPCSVYIAPADYHLLVEPDFTLSLSVEPKVNFSRPSIDVLFESAADVYKSTLIGVIMTGANNDGAKGLAYAQSKGALVMVEDPSVAETPTMPIAAIRETKTKNIMPIEGIAKMIKEVCS